MRGKMNKNVLVWIFGFITLSSSVLAIFPESSNIGYYSVQYNETNTTLSESDTFPPYNSLRNWANSSYYNLTVEDNPILRNYQGTNSAFEYDGSGDKLYINYSASTFDDVPFSISEWVYWDGTAGQNYLFDWFSNQINLGLCDVSGSTADICFFTGGSVTGKAQTTTAINSNTWYHVVATSDGSTTLNIYVDAGTPDAGTHNAISPATPYKGVFGGHAINPVLSFNGRLQSISVYNKTLNSSEISEIYAEGITYNPYLFSNFTISLSNNITAETIYNFTANISGTIFQSNNTGLITTGILSSNTTLLDIYLSSGGYDNRSFLNYNVSQSGNIDSVLHPSLMDVSIKGFEKVSGNVLNNFAINSSTYGYYSTTNGTINVSLPAINILFNITNTDGNYNYTDYFLDFSSEESINISFYNANLTVYAYDLINATGINTFNITITNNTYSYSESVSTTNGAINVNLSEGSYNLTIDPDGYEVKSVIVNIAKLNNTENITFYTTNSIKINIYDEITKDIIDYVNMTVELVGAESRSLTTTNGSLYLDLLTPSNYELRYFSTNVQDYKLRSIFITLDNRTFQEVNLYSLNESDTEITTATITFNVFDETLNSVEGATVIVSRYYADVNSYLDIWSRKTNSQGVSVGQFETIDAFYKYRVEYGEEIKYQSSEEGEQFNADDTISIFINIAPDLSKDFEEIQNIIFSPINFTNTSNSTGIFSFTYSYISSIDVCLTVTKSNYLGNFVNQTCLTGTGGTIFINVNSNNMLSSFDAVATAKVSENTGYITLDTKSVYLGEAALPTGIQWTGNMTWLGFLITILSVLMYIKKFPKIALVFQATSFIILTILPIKFLPVDSEVGITLGVSLLCIFLFIINKMGDKN